MIAACDNVAEPLAWMLRPGSAGSNTAADHLRLLDEAITALPPALRRKLMITCDGAGASHALVKELDRLAARHGYQVTYSVGWELGAREKAAIGTVPEPAWEAAIDPKGQVRERRADDACGNQRCAHRECWIQEAHVAELTGLPKWRPERSPTLTSVRRCWLGWRRPRRGRVIWTVPERWPSGPKWRPRTITNPEQRSQMLAVLAKAAAGAGDIDRAEAAARAITDPDLRARILAVLAEAAARAGDRDRAAALADQANTAALAIASLVQRVRMLALLAEAAARAGDPGRARALVEQGTEAGGPGKSQPVAARLDSGCPGRGGDGFW